MTGITQVMLAFIWCFGAAAQDIVAAPDLSIGKAHRGDFVAGQEGTYLIGITNVGSGATTGPITVRDTLPVGMTFVSCSGVGWGCVVDPGILVIGQPQRVTCTNPGPLSPGAATRFAMTVRVLEFTTPASVVAVNTAVVSTAGDLNPANDTARDPTVVLPGPGTSYILGVSIAGLGRVISRPQGIDCPIGSCIAKYPAGTAVDLFALPAAGWIFRGWSGGGCSGTGPCRVVTNQDTKIGATFIRWSFGTRIVLLVRNQADDTVDYFRRLLDAHGAPYREITADQIPSAGLCNAVIIAGFSSVPTEYEKAGEFISKAVASGSWMIADGFGKYLLAYAGIGSASPSSYAPKVSEKHGYVTNIDRSPLFMRIPRYDPPTPPAGVDQYIHHVVQAGTFDAVDYIPPKCDVRLVRYWALEHTPGSPELPTDSAYCKNWGGCTPERSVDVARIRLIRWGVGRIMEGLTGTGVIKGYREYGPVMRYLHRNFIAWRLLRRWCDFDGDGWTDPIVWRPAAGFWFARPSSDPLAVLGTRWGLDTDVAVPGDYDGDGVADIAVWRPASGSWLLLPSSSPGQSLARQWGTAGDVPVPEDYDGDGVADAAVWRPSSGTWFISLSGTPGEFASVPWGQSGDVPVPGDYDGDGLADIAAWRPSTGTWHVLSTAAPGEFTSRQWGAAGDVPVPGDYDGDGATDMAVWRPGSATWFILPSGSPGTFAGTQWGISGDVPVPGDYDGDGKADIAVYRQSTGFWYVLPSSAPRTFTSTQWGLPTDRPLSQVTRILGSAP